MGESCNSTTLSLRVFAEYEAIYFFDFLWIATIPRFRAESRNDEVGEIVIARICVSKFVAIHPRRHCEGDKVAQSNP